MRVITLSLLSLIMPFMLAAQYTYPKTKKVDQVDTYHGVKVADPYRWLEDDYAEDTKSWVTEQNKVTDAFLAKIPYREKLVKRLSELLDYPKTSSPFRKDEWYYYYANSGLQNQSVLYRKKGLEGTPELVIDPNLLSKEGTTRMASFSLSKDGKYAAVSISKGGSDWNTCKIMKLEDKSYLKEELEWVKVSGIGWEGDGFYYSRYPKPEGSELAAKNENHQVYFHKLGTNQSEDVLVYEDKNNPQRFHIAFTSRDENYTFLSISDRGKGLDGNAIYYKAKGEKAFKPIVAEITNNSYGYVDNVDGTFIFTSNEKAPNEKIIAYDSKTGKWKELISEKDTPLKSVSTGGGKMFVTYMKDVTTQAYVYSLDGKLERQITLPGLGDAGGFGGNPDDTFVFYSFTSFTYPSTTFKYDIATGTSTPYISYSKYFKAEDYETKQVFYQSKDGSSIPMFIVHKKGLDLNGKNPTLLYGYGGFNISLTPSFSALLMAWLEHGGVFAQANLRGGGEYGESWHEQGMKLQKQNVFDDFIAAGEYLIANKYCDSDHLALRGGSNGGLLVGAVINQRPDLAAVAIPQVGVMDMLRFQKFTIGWNWVADYGSSDNPEEFKVLYGYSPLHNIKAGPNYPATLVTTADHDDRVVPAHSFKYAAALQEIAGPYTNRPLLIKIEVDSGHGSSSTKKSIEIMADIYSFIWANMNFEPKF